MQLAVGSEVTRLRPPCTPLSPRGRRSEVLPTLLRLRKRTELYDSAPPAAAPQPVQPDALFICPITQVTGGVICIGVRLIDVRRAMWVLVCT